MASQPLFPHFKSVELGDRPVIQDILKAYSVETSELTFTNLFMWHTYSKARWCLYQDMLLIICRDASANLYAMQPVGPHPRVDAAVTLCRWLREERGVPRPFIDRSDSRFAAELADTKHFSVSPVRNHFDYVYQS